MNKRLLKPKINKSCGYVMVKSIINTGSKILRRILSRNPLGNYVILIQFSGQKPCTRKKKNKPYQILFCTCQGL